MAIPLVKFEVIVCIILNVEEVNKIDNPMKGLAQITWRPIPSEEEHVNNPHAIFGDKFSVFMFRMGMDLNCPHLTKSAYCHSFCI